MKTYIRRRLNSDIIIQDFKIIHGEKYDYSLVDYKASELSEQEKEKQSKK